MMLDDEAKELGLPTVALIVSDQVKLIRNNSVPMLTVQLNILTNEEHTDS